MILTHDQEQEIRNCCQRGDKIGLIKLYRFLTGQGLKEAKDAIESVCGCGSNWNNIPGFEGDFISFFKGGIEAIAKAKKEREEEERKAREEADRADHEKRKNRFIKASALMLDNWFDLGYESESKAMFDLVDRMVGNGLLKT